LKYNLPPILVVLLPLDPNSFIPFSNINIVTRKKFKNNRGLIYINNFREFVTTNLRRRNSAYFTNRTGEVNSITAVEFKLLFNLKTEILQGLFNLFSFAAKSDSETVSEAYEPSTREAEILVFKPSWDFILGDTAGVKLVV
jgi:hypothetical protein